MKAAHDKWSECRATTRKIVYSTFGSLPFHVAPLPLNDTADKNRVVYYRRKAEINGRRSVTDAGLGTKRSRIFGKHHEQDWTPRYQRFSVSTRDETGHKGINDFQLVQGTLLDTKGKKDSQSGPGTRLGSKDLKILSQHHGQDWTSRDQRFSVSIVDTKISKILSQHHRKDWYQIFLVGTRDRTGHQGIKHSLPVPGAELDTKGSKILSQHHELNWTPRYQRFTVTTRDRAGHKRVKDSQSAQGRTGRKGTGLDADVSKILSQHQKHDWTQKYERFLVSTRDRTGHQVIKDSQSAQWTRLDTKHQRFQST
ncbi:hypothetical protein Bbelb_083420 [Branchiostoma belcheri]|nr:hypothetical protein Bbelb_083420 [Branchiostoma belcheri]